MIPCSAAQHDHVLPQHFLGQAAPLTANYQGLTLHSAYQPIFSFASQQAVGFEALVRPHDAAGTPVSPLTLFEGVTELQGQIALDRLCRSLHLDNFAPQAPENSWLFLNVSPQVCVHGPRHSPFFAEQLRRSGLPPHRVVMEVVENAIADEQALQATVAYYKELGCLVALDDFGTGHSNFNRVWSLQPDIVKLDRSIIHQAASNPRVRRSLPSLVAMLHEAGSLVLAEGVENEAEVQLAMEAEVDLLQGFLFAKPTATTVHAPRVTPVQLCERWRASGADAEQSERQRLHSHQEHLFAMAGALCAGASLHDAGTRLANRPDVIRAYLLDDKGVQQAECRNSGQDVIEHSPKFSPLQRTGQTSWYRRSYFRSAMAHPGQVQVSSPYLSLLSSSICITLSLAFELDGRQHVLCCDLDRQTMERNLASAA